MHVTVYFHYKNPLSFYEIVRVSRDYCNDLKDNQECFWIDGEGQHYFTCASDIPKGSEVVFYRSRSSGKCFARTAQNFFGETEEGILRFQEVES